MSSPEGVVRNGANFEARGGLVFDGRLAFEDRDGLVIERRGDLVIEVRDDLVIDDRNGLASVERVRRARELEPETFDGFAFFLSRLLIARLTTRAGF